MRLGSKGTWCDEGRIGEETVTRPPSLWLRHESKEGESRVAVTPADAGRLVAGGVEVTVEDSAQRVFPLADYVAVGCHAAEPGSWVDAPADRVILGLKELPDEPEALTHRHIYFGHAFKRQPGAETLLRRFAAGGGELLDLEYVTDGKGRRLAAFGYWAGYVGAALGVLLARNELTPPLHPTTRAELDKMLAGSESATDERAIVVGALGRSGSGARAALAVAGSTPTSWDIEETRQLDKPALLAHDLLVNAVYSAGPVTPFLTPDDVADADRRLSTVVDVTCDVGSPYSVLPIYDSVTDWQEPVRRLGGDGHPMDLIAIDNLPSLLPEEASVGFSADLTPHLFDLDTEPWSRCAALFVSTLDSWEILHG
jgi:saccharopine dehydrogenase (NAD+, L-lysine-forming)